MPIRIPCLVPGKVQEIVLCTFSDGEPEDAEKVAARLLGALENLSAAVFDQLTTFMVESATAHVTAKDGYSPRDVRRREKTMTWLTRRLVTTRRRTP
jgi:hypothetical protein